MNIKARSQSIFVKTPLVINSTGVRTIIVSVQAFKMWYGVIVKLSMTHTFIFPLLHASKVFSFHLFNEGEKKFAPVSPNRKYVWSIFWLLFSSKKYVTIVLKTCVKIFFVFVLKIFLEKIDVK